MGTKRKRAPNLLLAGERLSVNLPAMADADNQDKEESVFYLINDPVIAAADPVAALMPLELLHSRRPRLLRQGIDGRGNPQAHRLL